ncbi:MAG TPA: DUF349 domain-containing protein [Micrococcaceae bacterium]|nr:DUF349 domain-containing protein [Micrococcaceae bacterium]
MTAAMPVDQADEATVGSSAAEAGQQADADDVQAGTVEDDASTSAATAEEAGPAATAKAMPAEDGSAPAATTEEQAPTATAEATSAEDGPAPAATTEEAAPSAAAEATPAEDSSAPAATTEEPAPSATAEATPAEDSPAPTVTTEETSPATTASAAGAAAPGSAASAGQPESSSAVPARPSSPVPAPAPVKAPSPAAFAARPKSPAAARPAGIAAPAAAAHPVAPANPGMSAAEAAKWGRAEDDGHVFLLLDGEEVPVGQYPGASKDEALGYFARKFDDIVAQVALLEQRVEVKAPTTDMHKTVSHLRGQLTERNAIGDVRGTEARLNTLEDRIKALEQAERAEHEAARAAELEAREAIVAEAEQISGQEPASIQWKTSSARMNELFETWKTAQKSGMRLGRSTEDALWKRFRSARTVFDRHRRAYFSALDSNNSAARTAKEKLIAEAEELSSSTDWGFAAAEYRRLMDQWKASPRASRKDDDALWARFRAAQDKFFAARQSVNAALDEEFAQNLVVKEGLLAEARGLLPVKDLAAAKKSLQSIHDRWEAAGKVPRGDMHRVEAALRQVEDAVRKAEDDVWRRTDPETKARTNSVLNQLEATIASLRDDLAAAEEAGDQRRIKSAQEALAAREQWLEQVQKSAGDLD